MELTILMPCLNEEKTIEKCVLKARKFLETNNINGEVLVLDNGSSDNSVECARVCGARVVNAARKGYGSALIEGNKQAKGKYIIMGDSDDSYNFEEIFPFLNELRNGKEFVMGNIIYIFTETPFLKTKMPISVITDIGMAHSYF